MARFKYIHSLSEGNGNLVTAICLGVNGRKSHMGSFMAAFTIAGVPVLMKLKLNSPMVTYFDLVQRGTGNIRVSYSGYFRLILWQKELK